MTRLSDVARARNFLGRLSQAEQRQSLQLQKQRQGQIHAQYDAARISELTNRYWRNADAQSADAANSPEIRATLRQRSRYECVENNSILCGIGQTLANDVIGQGPTLQMQIPGREALNEKIEQRFREWAKQIGLARKLHTMRMARFVDGECFAQFVTNRRLRGVQLDLRLIEADQIASPLLSFDRNRIDGLEYDEQGVVIRYHLLRDHPGAPWGASYETTPIPADQMLHLFRRLRPGQHRGIPETTPALPLVALLRDYTLAVLHSARSAAKFTAVLETQAGATAGDEAYDPDVEPFDIVDIDYDMITSIPFGWKLNQFKAEQPTTTFKEFRDCLIGEIARCVHMPFNIATANSSSYNFASGRLDNLTYDGANAIERELEWGPECMDRILQHWLDEALLIDGYLGDIGPLGDLSSNSLPHTWIWTSRPNSDRLNEAQGQAGQLKNGTTTRVREYAAAGRDLDQEDAQAARSYGVTIEEYRRRLFETTYAVGGSASQPGTDPAEHQAAPESDQPQETPANAR